MEGFGGLRVHCSGRVELEPESTPPPGVQDFRASNHVGVKGSGLYEGLGLQDSEFSLWENGPLLKPGGSSKTPMKALI